MNCIVISVFLMVIPSLILCENGVFHLDITPEAAQKLIAEQKLNVDYAQKVGEHVVPVRKNNRGDTVYQGRVLENPDDFIEEEYLAKQHHGQDGLGRYLFHYEDWNQGRMEAKNANGEIRGHYKYKDLQGDEVIVNYWADSLGFHQEDNLAKTVLEPVTDEPVVQAAKEEHLRRWKLAAEAAKVNPDPMSDVYNRLANQYDEHRAQLDQANEIVGHFGDSKLSRVETKTYWQPDENEIIDPRGFFYSFQYPVNVLRKIREDHENLKKLKRESEKKETENDEKTSSGHEIEAVHDVQVPRKQNSLRRRSAVTSDKTKNDNESVQIKLVDDLNEKNPRVSAVHDVQVPKQH